MANEERGGERVRRMRMGGELRWWRRGKGVGLVIAEAGVVRVCV